MPLVWSADSLRWNAEFFAGLVRYFIMESTSDPSNKNVVAKQMRVEMRKKGKSRGKSP